MSIASHGTSLISASTPYKYPVLRGKVRLAALHQLRGQTSEHHLTHIDNQGRPVMVDVSNKDITNRAVNIDGNSELLRRQDKSRAKGDVLAVAQLAGIMASKKTSDLIPLCHPVPLSHVLVELFVEDHSSSQKVLEKDKQYSISCRATATCESKTGVEMEALTAVSVSLLTVWDMLKAVAGKEMLIDGIYVAKKSGGMSGDFVRKLDETMDSQ